VGQTLGYLLAFSGFLALAEARSVSLPAFMWAWGVAFLASAAAVAATPEAGEEAAGSLQDVYRHTWRLLRQPAIARLCALLLTSRAAFGAAEALTQMKLMEAGMSKATWARLAGITAPLELLLPLALARWTGGDRPLAAYLAAYPLRLAVGVATAAVASCSPAAGAPRVAFNAAVLGVLAARTLTSQSQFVAQMAFFARVADPAIGGTAMTLLNTVANLASKWPASLVLFAAEPLTRRACLPSAGGAPLGAPGVCRGGGSAARDACAAAGGACAVLADAFPPLTAACTLLGLLWLYLCRGSLLALQELPLSAWRPRGGVQRE
jgi:PAT family acetyl-CoA transporter-like MFS transporter 1